MSPGRTRGKQTGLSVRIKVWLESEGSYVFGHGLCSILQAVDRRGSIKQAAGELEKSYRYTWGRIKEAERTLGLQLVETHVGGKGVQRSNLTPTARRLVENFVALRRKLLHLAEREWNERPA